MVSTEPPQCDKDQGTGVELEKDQMVLIYVVNVDTVDNDKYLGVHIGNKLDWARNTKGIYKRRPELPLLPVEAQFIQLTSVGLLWSLGLWVLPSTLYWLCVCVSFKC